MSTRKVSFAVDEYYHLYTRGVEKRAIFLDFQDYNYFLFLMFICNTQKPIRMKSLEDKEFERGDTIVDLGVYCLMPNHIHILTKEKVEGGISKYMLKLLTSYSIYFNKKYKRSGRLYESTFKSKHVDGDTYLKYLYAYIHLNPAKLIDKNWKKKRTKSTTELFKFTEDYTFSSLQEYLKTDEGLKRGILNSEVFPDYFKNSAGRKHELFEWLSFEDLPLQG